MSTGTVVAAVDSGATSIRVCVVDLDTTPVEATVVHRFEHTAVEHTDGSLRWDWDRLVGEAQAGLDSALEAGPLASIGIDTWGVDYGLLDESGDLVAPPHSYRDTRTQNWRAVLDRIGPEYFHGVTGIQFMPANTIFQLAAHDPAETARARHLLLIPELLIHQLGGRLAAEATSASTTGLVDIETGDWSDELIATVGADPRWFRPIEEPGAVLGSYRGTPIRLVGGHDTASAVVAMCPTPGPRTAFLSGGTWFLVGRELAEPDVSDAALEAGFSNERGTFGTTRLLRNQAGTWLIEECRRAWGDPPVNRLLEEASRITGVLPTIDVDHEDLFSPEDMPRTICALAGRPNDTDPATIVRIIVESLASRAAEIVDRLGKLSAGAVEEIAIFGGASVSALIRDRIASATGLPVRQGPSEATALGNALTQGVALGRYADQREARASLAD